MSDPPARHATRRVVLTPPPSNPRLQACVLSVECAEDEEIEWQCRLELQVICGGSIRANDLHIPARLIQRVCQDGVIAIGKGPIRIFVCEAYHDNTKESVCRSSTRERRA